METPNLILPSKSSKQPSTTLCLTCNKIFSTPINLRNHILTIHEHTFPFKCPYPSCSKSYSIETRLKVHIKTHLGQKPFTCEQCGKSFLEKGNLKTHIRFHSSLRPFKCHLCNKSYKTKGHLKDHINIQHHHIKKYHCDICNCNFGRSSTLKAHIRTHSGVKNIKCLIQGCEKYFSEKGNMLIHYKRHLMKMQLNKEEEEVLNNSNNAILTRPESNVTLALNEDVSSRVDNILKTNIYNDDNNESLHIINDNSTSSNSNSNNNHIHHSLISNNKFYINDIQIDDKPFQFDFSYL